MSEVHMDYGFLDKKEEAKITIPILVAKESECIKIVKRGDGSLEIDWHVHSEARYMEMSW